MGRSGTCCSTTLVGEVQQYPEEIQHGFVKATVLTAGTKHQACASLPHPLPVWGPKQIEVKSTLELLAIT